MKTLVGIERSEFKSKETGEVFIKTILHFLEDAGYGGEGTIGQRVSSETLWGISDISKELKIHGELKIGCHATLYYEGEGKYKKPTLLICEK